MALPQAPKAPQTVRREMSGSQVALPLSTVVSTFAPNLFPVSWQVGGVAQVTQSVAVPGLSSGGSQVISTPVGLAPSNVSSPNALPLNPISLGNGQTALIFVSVFLGGPAVASPFYGLPFVRLSFLTGVPAAGAGSIFTLTGPGTFTSPTVTVSIPVYAPATFSATSVLLTVEALLLGVSS